MQTEYPLNTRFKTVREIQLERKNWELQRELQRSRFGVLDFKEVDLGLIREGNPPREIKLPIMCSITARPDDEAHPYHLGVAARVWTDKPFGLNYYLNAGLLTEADAAQVLGLQHETFIRQLVNFLEKQKTEKK